MGLGGGSSWPSAIAAMARVVAEVIGLFITRWAKWTQSTMGQMGQHDPNKNPRVMLGLSLQHVGQHGTAHTFIRAVPCLALRHEHDTNGPQAGLAWPDLSDYHHPIQGEISNCINS
jgi:hypothetical protein